jgi:hypothetical protein
VGSANAETGTAELQTPGDPPPRAPREAGEGREVWWAHAREVLLSDLQLSAEQSRGVDAIFETQMAALARQREMGAELQAARQRGDRERSASLRSQMRAARKNPHDVFDETRALLSEEQRPIFDMNRARLVAEGQQAERARQAQRRRRQASGGGGGGAVAEVE